MTKTLHRLTTTTVKNEKRPGLHADGGGLYLRVAPGGSKQWIFRYVHKHETAPGKWRTRDLGLGPAHTLTLAEAREYAREQRKLRLHQVDPIAHKREQQSAALVAAAGMKTFRECAEGFMIDNEASWTSAKHREQWRSSLAKFVYPAFGSLSVSAIDTPLVLKVIKPLWQRAPETASRVRGRIEAVLGWASVHHYRTGDNPARWSQHLEHALPAVTKGAHHAALPYAEIAAFMSKLREDTSVAARCVEFIALTAVRLGEARDATWDEIDLEARTWTIPAKRMKGGKEHKVPLSAAAMAVLEAMRAVRQSDYVFPGFRQGQPVGHNLWRVVKPLAGAEITVHGLRSTFRDWAAERTSYPREIAEAALAHAVPSQVEAAYRRTDFFDRRRRLMDAWADFCAKPAATGKVLTFRGQQV
jgi:integrase